MKDPTLRMYRAETKRFLDRFWKLYHKEPATLDDIEQYLRDVHPEIIKSVSSLRFHICVVRRWYREKWGRILVLNGERMGQKGRLLQRLLNPTIDRIVENLPGEPCGVFLQTLLSTGWKCRDLLSLRNRDFSTDTGILQLRIENTLRRVSLNPELKFRLCRIQKGGPDAFLFPSLQNVTPETKGLSMRSLQFYWARVCQKHRLDLSLQDLRKCNIVRRMRQGQNRRTIRKETGFQAFRDLRNPYPPGKGGFSEGIFSSREGPA